MELLYTRLLFIFVTKIFSGNLVENASYKNRFYFNLSVKNLEDNSKMKSNHVEFKTVMTRHLRRMKRDTFSNDPCYENGLCKSNNVMEQHFCYCDRFCYFYGDCCYDAKSNYTVMHQGVPKRELHKCMCNPLNYPFQCYNMVVACSETFKDKSIIQQCGYPKSRLLKVPVWDENGITYYNAFCAMCNHVTNYKLAEVTFDVNKCFKVSLNNTYRLDNTSCEPNYNPPKDFFLRRCFDVKFLNKNEKCTQYQNPVSIKDTWFKNYFCSINGDQYTGSQILPYKCVTAIGNDKMHNVHPFTVMFTFSPPTLTTDKAVCNDVEVYDDILKICRKTSCESGREPYEGICLEAESYTNYKLNVDYRFFVNETVEKGYLIRLSNLIFQNLQNKKNQITADSVNYTLTHGLQPGSKNGCSEIAATVKFNIGSKLPTLDKMNSLQSTMFGFKLTYYEYTDSDGQITELNTLTSLNQCKPTNNVTIQLKWDKIEEPDMEVNQSNITDSQFCFDIRIKALLLKNGKIRIISVKCRNLSETKYLNIEDKSYLRFDIKTILTYICMGLSCVALTISIFIYRVLGFSNSIPGSNTENLYITLLFAHTLFLVGIGANDNQTVCKYVGIVIHYFWLASFAFMTIAVLNIAVTFYKIAKNPNIKTTTDECLKGKFIGVGYTLPILVVFPCALLDFLNIPSFRVEYNGNVCFPTGYPANIIFVSGPMALSVTINVICLLIVVCSIQRQTAGRKQLDKSVLSYLPVYLRLSLLVGTIWIFGILSSVITNEILQNIFIALGSLHGFFVSVACTCTVRVFNSFKTKSTKRSNPSPMPMET